MWLIQCLACLDVLRLTELERRCLCMRSRGHLIDGDVRILGPSRVLALEGAADRRSEGRWVSLPLDVPTQRQITPPLL